MTSSNETLDELYATNKAKVTVTGSGTITLPHQEPPMVREPSTPAEDLS